MNEKGVLNKTLRILTMVIIFIATELCIAQNIKTIAGNWQGCNYEEGYMELYANDTELVFAFDQSYFSTSPIQYRIRRDTLWLKNNGGNYSKDWYAEIISHADDKIILHFDGADDVLKLEKMREKIKSPLTFDCALGISQPTYYEMAQFEFYARSEKNKHTCPSTLLDRINDPPPTELPGTDWEELRSWEDSIISTAPQRDYKEVLIEDDMIVLERHFVEEKHDTIYVAQYNADSSRVLLQADMTVQYFPPHKQHAILKDNGELIAAVQSYTAICNEYCRVRFYFLVKLPNRKFTSLKLNHDKID